MSRFEDQIGEKNLILSFVDLITILAADSSCDESQYRERVVAEEA